MIKKLTILYLLGATCFYLVLPTGGQLTRRQQQVQIQNKNLQAQRESWQSTPLQNANLQANGPPFRSQESENEINDGQYGGGVEPAPVTEDKQLPDEPPQTTEQQQPQPTSPVPQLTQAPVTVPNKIPPILNLQPSTQRPYYGPVYPNFNQRPNTPITQYSGIQVSGYQKEQTGQAPVSQHQQMFYAGGSNSIPMMIYSDSATPPITMFYLGQGDKQIQGAIPNLQPFNPQTYSQPQGLVPFSIPMPSQSVLDSVPVSPVNSWDRQIFPMFETFSPQQFYPSNVDLLKTKESQRGERVMSKLPLKPKAAEMEMNIESELYRIPMGRAAMMISSDNVFNPRAANNQFMQPWMMPQSQRLATIDNMRSVVSPFWGKSMPSSWNEPMARASSNDFEISMLGSRYTSLPASTYTSGGSSHGTGGGQSYGSSGQSYGGSGQPYGTDGGQSYGSSGGSAHSPYNSGTSGYTSGSPSSSLHSSNGGQYSSSKPSSSLYTSGSQGYSTSPSGYSSYSSGSKPSGSQYSGSSGSSLYSSSGHGSSGSSGSSLYSSGGHGSSGYSSGSYGKSAGILSGLPITSSHNSNTGQHSSMDQGGYSQAQAGSGSQNLNNHDKQGTSFVQPLPNGGQVASFSTSQKGYSGASQGQSSLSNSNKKYESQHGGSQGASSYLSPGSSHINIGSQGAYGSSGMRGPGLLGAVGPQSSQYQNSQASYGVPTNAQRFDKDTPIIAIVPVGVVLPSDQEQLVAPGQNQLHPGSIPTGSQTRGFSGPRSAILGAQYGYGGIGVGGADYGSSGLNNQYSNLHNGQLAGQSSGASNNQQYGHENVNTGFVQPLPMGGSVYSNVNSDKGFSGGNYGQGSQSVGVADQNFNAGGLSANQGYTGVNGLGAGGLGTGILPGTGLGYAGRIGGLNTGLGLNGGLGVAGVGVGGVGVGGVPLTGLYG